MTVSSPLFRLRWLSVAALVGLLASPVWAQYRAPAAPVQPYRYIAPNGPANRAAPTPNRYTAPVPNRYAPAASQQPGTYRQGRRPFRTAERAEATGHARAHAEQMNNANAEAAPGLDTTTVEGEHPMMPALRWAHGGVKNLEKVQDYSATIIKRERIGNKVGGQEYMFVKIRHKPFSVYTRFLAPEKLKGQECLYVEGKNNGKMWAHGVGLEKKLFGTVSIPPDGAIAMRGQRYPLTEIGVLNLVRRLVEVAQEDIKYGECDVKFFKGAKINNRVCTVIQAIHPVPRSNFKFHLARIFVDDELNIPIRYESYDWPTEQGGQPQLIEEYTYLDLKLNQGFTDGDFDINNPAYDFVNK